MPTPPQPLRWHDLAPLLLGPIVMAAIWIMEARGAPAWYTKPNLEVVAIILAATAVLVATAHVAVRPNALRGLLTGFTIVVLCREIHWDWTHRAVYVSLAVLAVTTIAVRRHVRPVLDQQPRTRAWLWCTAATYVLAQLVARRFFRGIIPNEELIYDVMEEAMEDVAHAMLLVTVSLGPWRRISPRTSPASAG